MKENYTHETFAPGFDPHGNNTKIEREEDLEVAGVNLVGSKLTDPFGSNEVSLKPMLTSPAPARLMMMGNSIHAETADDETYALPADKGVIAEVIPDDHLPTDQEGNKADIITLPYLTADHDGNVAIPRPRQLTRSNNHQRNGYSRRKAKRRASWNGLFKVRVKDRASRLMGWLDSSSELKFDKNAAFKTGCGVIDKALSGGVTAGQWSGIHPQRSALAPSVSQAIAHHVEAEGQKVWRENTKGE